MSAEAGYITTRAELEAYALMQRGHPKSNLEGPEAVTEAANDLIVLAERIKSERAVAAMQGREGER